MKNIISISLITFSVLVLSGCSLPALTSSPTSTPTTTAAPATNMKIYQDQTHQYQFQYPDTFMEIESEQNMFTAESNQYTLSSQYYTDSSSLDQWLESIREANIKNDLRVSIKTANGREILAESRMGSGSLFERNVFILDGDNVLRITLSADVTIKGNEEPEVYAAVEDLAATITNTVKFN